MSTAHNQAHIVRRHARRHLLAILVAASIVAGCGGGSSSGTSKSAQAATPPATPVTAPATTPTPPTSTAPPASPPPPTSPPPNSAPTLKGQLPAQVLAGGTLTFTPEASDPDGDPLTFSASGLPAWMAFDARTGTVTGKPGAGDVGVYSNIVISVSDGRATTSLDAQWIAVVPVASGKATLSWVPPTENVDGTPITNLAGYRIRYGTAPDALDITVEIKNPGVASYVVEDLTPATWYFVVTAFTSAGVESGLSNLASKTISG